MGVVEMKQFLLICIFFICCSTNAFSQTYLFPVTHWVVTRNDGTHNLYDSAIDLAMQELNKAFAPANIQFYLSCNTTRSNDD